MANSALNTLMRIYRRMSLIDRVIVIFLVICFIFPLTLPNWLTIGYREIDVESQKKCDFLILQDGEKLSSKQQGPISDISQMFENNTYLNSGGKYVNKRCKTDQHVGIIVPYRNRSEHLKTFAEYIHPFLVKQNAINYQIFVIEQDDQLPFNRGNLLNIGFHEALRLYHDLNCFVFHDVDILPLDLRQLYTCSHTPRHLCSYLDKFRYVLLYPDLFGGVIAVERYQFAKVNGFSNLYSGWGAEDDDFYRRISQQFGLIERYPKSIGRCVMLSHHQNQVISESRSKLLKQALQRFQTDGLSNLNTTYVRKQVEYNQNYVKIKVSLK